MPERKISQTAWHCAREKAREYGKKRGGLEKDPKSSIKERGLATGKATPLLG